MNGENKTVHGPIDREAITASRIDSQLNNGVGQALKFEYIVWASFDGGHHYVPCSKPFPKRREAVEWAGQLNAADWNIHKFESGD